MPPTGMSRIGFKDNAESADIVKEISQLPNLDTEGLFTHFARADEMLDQIGRRDIQKRHKVASAWKGSVPACGASLRLMCSRRKTARFSVAMLYYYTIFFPDKTV